MPEETCDIVIVGAGSAGCVLANRLSADPARRVVLIEAGGSDRRFWVRTPLGYAFTFTDPRVNWCYTAQPDPGLAGRRAYVPRGKILGGSSAINAMAYMRGLPHDFDDWAAAGAAGWGWDAVKATYDAIETVSTPAKGGRQMRGDGPVHVSDISDRMHPFARHFLDAGRDMGWPVLPDINAAGGEGLGMLHCTVRGGRRWSAADAFLHPVRHRPNLRIVTDAHVERVTFDGTRATGVVYRRGAERIGLQARRMVILSAGAVDSPKLLELSGVGDADLLRARGVAVHHALPRVGTGLQDHFALTQYFHTDRRTLNTALGTRRGRLLAGLRYVLTRSGPLSTPVNHCSGYVRAAPDAPAPDMQVYANPASYSIDASGKTVVDREQGFLLSAQPCRPTSRGSVHIASPDPAAAPLIRPDALSTEEDRAQAILAGRLLQRLMMAPTLRALTTARKAPDITGMDDAALLDTFRERAGSVFHLSCTCRMGHDAGDSVVDARLRVHGLSGLRVVDSACFPNVTSGNTNAPTMMLAARAAGMIIEDEKT